MQLDPETGYDLAGKRKASMTASMKPMLKSPRQLSWYLVPATLLTLAAAHSSACGSSDSPNPPGNSAGTGGTAGGSGNTGTGGSAGTSGAGGSADVGGAAGTSGAAGTAGTSGSAGTSGAAGAGGGTAKNALSFQGLGDVSVVDSPSLRVQDTTMEAWCSFSSLSGSYFTIVGKPLGGGTQDSYGFWYENGGLHAGINPENPQTALSYTWMPTLGAWYHLAFTYDHTTKMQLLYVNGNQVASGSKDPPVLYDTHPVLLGGDNNYGNHDGLFYGSIDEVRIWNLARSAADIKSTMNRQLTGSESGLVGYWRFNEGSGKTAADSSGHGNSGQLISFDPNTPDPTWTTSGAPF